MKQNEFIELVKHPLNAGVSDLEKLQELKKQFPFFQSAHILLTLVSKKYNTSVYQQTLKQTAIAIPNRAWLHNLLNSSDSSVIVNIQETKEVPVEVNTVSKIVVDEKVEDTKVSELDHLKAIELNTENQKTKEEVLNELVEKEIQKDIITAFVEKEVLKTPDWYKKETAKQEEVEENKKEEKAEQKQEFKAGSFTDWLQALKKSDRTEPAKFEKKEKPVKEEKKEVKIEEKKEDEGKIIEKKAQQQAIIDKIIEVNPTTIRLDPNQRFFAADTKAKESLIENEDLVTETLAKIYALQGNISKAVRAYEILSLKFPQKSAYFATLIQNLKKQNQ